jgi:hypothetical protein
VADLTGLLNIIVAPKFDEGNAGFDVTVGSSRARNPPHSPTATRRFRPSRASVIGEIGAVGDSFFDVKEEP